MPDDGALVPYRPHEGLVASIGPPRAAQLLRQVLERAEWPYAPASVDVTPDGFIVSLGDPNDSPARLRMPFVYLERLELYESNRIYIDETDGADLPLAYVRTGDREDALLLLDLLASYRRMHRDWPPLGQPDVGEPAPEPCPAEPEAVDVPAEHDPRDKDVSAAVR